MALTLLDILSPGLIQELDLNKPLTKPVEFRLINAGIVDNSSTRKVISPQFYGFPGQDSINDPLDKNAKVKTILNITGYNSIKGKPGEPTYMDPITEYVKFDSGSSVWCQPGEENKYLYLKVNNRNRDYPYRNPRKAPKYYEVNEKREMALKNNEFTYTYLAAGLLMDLDSNEVNNIAISLAKAFPGKYVFNVALEIEQILLQLESVAKSNPVDLIVAVKEPNSLARVVADDAVNRRLIFFDDHAERLTWKWKSKVKSNIVKLAAGNNPVKGLVDYLISADGNEAFIELKQLNEKYYRPR